MEDLTASQKVNDPGHVVITGATSGIGQAGAIALARAGWRVTVVGRDAARVEATLALVGAAATGPAPAGALADFARLDDVRALAERLSGERIDVLANNAGVVARSRVTTVDGHELTIQTNHLAPFLLTSLLRERLAPGARIVNTASVAHNTGSLDPDNLDRTGGVYSAWLAYGGSKRANILFAAEAARRWPDLLSYSFHPGVVRTRFGTPLAKLFYKIAPGLATPEQGADQLVWLSTADPAQLVNGGYYVSRKLTPPNPAIRDPQLAARVWEASAKAVGL
ncbi:retinol dehydrogenase [Catellatospora sp. TT07R-123]|uniref:SDR family NAD(P)-dependent oxidoreductase n=1 Tax=Catellatospora sp. TT07R-123 TaxID=2733863 RepID=UPI001B2F1031|nr:SDR family NAD(P)-dependent oxidoreductase [Catellatospora sp. TT07R-123]GHJ50416.1 retinol dehydrogenase [Catellatospora sp. TT07R-123]